MSRKKMRASSEQCVVRFTVPLRPSRLMNGARSASSQSVSRPNKRMHATRDTTLVIISRVAGGRVMRGVRPNHSAQ